MKKSVLDVQLMNGPRMGQSKCEHNTYGSGLDDWTESLLIINARTLSEASENPPGLITIKRAIRQKLVTINPFTGDDVHTRWTGNQSPSVVDLSLCSR